MPENNRLTNYALILFTILFAVKLYFISNTFLVDDEAYYAMYARHLAWGYIDHGPVVAFIIWIFTFLNESSFTVRLGPVILMSFLTIFLYSVTKKHMDQQFALITSLALIANLMFHTNSIIITPDVPLAFFSILSILFYYLAYFKDERFIYPGGIMLGLSVLSKVSALFPAIGIFLFPFLVKEKRYMLKNVHFYASFFISFIIFIPFIVWNFKNDFAFVKYQGSHILEGGGFSDFLELWAGAVLLIGPLFFYYSAIKPIIYLKDWMVISSEKKYFGLVTSIPLSYFLFHSLFSRFELNWIAPIFFGGLFILAAEESQYSQTRKRLHIQIIYSLFFISLIMIQTFYPLLPLKGKSDPTNRYYMYTSLVKDVKTSIMDDLEMNKLRIVSNEFQIPSIINFYLNPQHEAICLSIDYHETLYSFHYDQQSLIGEDFIYIHDKKEFPEKIKPFFDSYEPIMISNHSRNNSTVASYSIWAVKNYKGKL